MTAVTHYNNIFMADMPWNYSSPSDLSDYVLLDEAPVECPMPVISTPSPTQVLFSPVVSTQMPVNDSSSGGGGGTRARSGVSLRKQSEGGGVRVAFRMKSEVEILDDGFKWRKYGKKSVKNSPNPRNYYRCSAEGCTVKKRVERDREEPSYVITTYEGVHNHTSSDMVYYTTQDTDSGRFVISGCHHMH